MPNRLSHETSPYLLQHANNPVDWYPWGDEAFQKARAENRPVFLSIGYSACHWCHVMERESFENEAIAAILNRDWVSIKVDREERPDVDSIYMEAVQIMTGHGGWPMSMFLTPEGVPFYGGTYFPPVDSRGLPGFGRVLEQLAQAYRERPDEIATATGEIRAALGRAVQGDRNAGEVSHATLEAAAAKIASNYDPVHGGFGAAPKFPPSMTLEFLLQVVKRTGSAQLANVVTTTLSKMAAGGMYDQIGGGFHRYSVDARWLVPHFEKMLYDNALLARLYVHAWQQFGDARFASTADEILGFVSRELMSPDGGFYSSLDADSEGEEGKFYVWSRREVLEILGEEEGRQFCALFDITQRGNFEGHNIPNRPRAIEDVAEDLGVPVERLVDVAMRGKCKLYGARAARVAPGRDEKILAGWNGWMLAAFAEAAIATRAQKHLEVVRRNADFLIATMVDGDQLYRTYKDGRRRIGGLLEDYAGVAWGLIHAFEATQDRRYLDVARVLACAIVTRFVDPEDGSFFDTPSDHETLIVRPKDLFDNATPAGNSLAIDVLFRLALYFADEELDRAARRALQTLWPVASRFPSGFGFLLSAGEWSVARVREIAVTGSDAEPLWKAVGEVYLPHRILASPSAGSLPLLEGRAADRTAVWICEGYACLAPIEDPDGVREALRA